MPDLPPFQVPHNIVQRRAVPSSETRAGSPGALMRQPVSCDHNGMIRYGQVVGYTRLTFTIRTSDDSFTVPHASVTEVAPITVFLLHRLRRATTDVGGALEDRHNMILDRLLGHNSARATKSIPKLLAGICDRSAYPNDSDVLAWINPSTGVECQVSVRHVIDFGYYKDGDKRIPSRLVDSIGDSFFNDPLAGVAPQPTASQHPVEHDDFDDYLATMDAEEAEADRAAHATTRVEEPAQPAHTFSSHPTVTSVTDPTVHARILAALADTPELLKHYLELEMAASGRKRHAESGDTRVSKVPRLSTLADLSPGESHAEHTRSKESFRPSSSSRLIHTIITADEHKGKAPVEFIELSMSSPATKFRPHPGVLIRLFQFGIRGLSVWHFQRFDLLARREWTRSSKVNMANFAASVEVPPPTGDRSIQGLSDALAVLAVYAEEFFDQATRRLIVDAKEFCEELRGHTRWEPADIDTLSYWFDSVLETYRRAANDDLVTGSNSRSHVREKLSMQDPGLQSMLYVIQTERLAALSTHKRHETAQRHDHRNDVPRTTKIPREVIEALPRQGGKSVCLKNLSRQGCPSRTKDKCVVPNRSHFVPAAIPSVVSKYLEEHLGGTRPELSNQ